MSSLCAVHIYYDICKLSSEYDCEEGLKKFLDNSDHSIVGELAAPDLCVASEPKVKLTGNTV